MPARPRRSGFDAPPQAASPFICSLIALALTAATGAAWVAVLLLSERL